MSKIKIFHLKESLKNNQPKLLWTIILVFLFVVIIIKIFPGENDDPESELNELKIEDWHSIK